MSDECTSVAKINVRKHFTQTTICGNVITTYILMKLKLLHVPSKQLCTQTGVANVTIAVHLLYSL